MNAFVEIDTEREIEKVISKLNKIPDQIAAPGILKNALNATIRKVKKQAVKDTGEKYALKDKSILKKESQGAPRVYTASVADLVATIRSKGSMQDIMAFNTKQNGSTSAAAAQVLKNGGMKPLQTGKLKAFVVKFASGHTAIVQRHPPQKYGSGRERRAAAYGGGADMTKIKKLLSPSVPHMMGNEEVIERANQTAQDILHAEMDKRIEKALAK